MRHARFGSMMTPTHFMADAIGKSKGFQNIFSRFLRMREGQGGDMHVQFVQDTCIFFAPKAACSRSLIELFESAFVEFTESASFYYFPPIMGGMVFWPLMHKLAGKKFNKNLLAAPLSETPKHLLKKVAAPKLALALVTCGLSISVLYSMNFIKNLITEHKFQKNVFSDVIGLSEGKTQRQAEDSPVTAKAKRRLKQIGMFSAAILAGSFLLARYGHKLPSRFDKNIKFMADWLDYRFKPVRNPITDKVMKYNFDLGRNHLKLILPFDIVAYNDATRDHLEFVEVLSRTLVTGTYISYWQPIIESKWYQWAGKQYRNLGIFKGTKKGEMMGVREIAELSMQLAEKQLKGAPKNTVKQLAIELFQKRMAVKNKLFFGPFLFGILGIGLFTALTNRFWTKYRFQQSEKENFYSPNSKFKAPNK